MYEEHPSFDTVDVAFSHNPTCLQTGEGCYRYAEKMRDKLITAVFGGFFRRKRISFGPKTMARACINQKLIRSPTPRASLIIPSKGKGILLTDVN